MKIDRKLEELFLDLPEPPLGAGAAVRVGEQLIVDGALPFSEGRIQFPGRVGVEVRLDSARLAARLAAVVALAVARRELGGKLDAVQRVLRTEGAVACGADFSEHLKVVDGATELFAQLFGAKGKGTRTAFGATSLPQRAPVMLTVTFEMK